MHNEVELDDEPEVETNNQSWRDAFSRMMPFLQGDLCTILSGVPEGYEEAMLIHTLSMFGAMCFSRVRVKYLDGKLHAPNIQLVVEAPWGSGKEKFNTLFNSLFADVIAESQEKVNNEENSIIQFLGVGMSTAKFKSILAHNREVHFYMFASEIRSIIDDLRKGNGLSYEHLRLAFDNGTVFQDKMNGAPKGHFPVCFNYTFTGTPNDVQQFIGKELEGGTASRICWAEIPEAGRELENLELSSPEEMDCLKEKIKTWRQKYSFTTCDGKDEPADITEIDLSFLHQPLKKWLVEQYDHGKKDGNPTRIQARARIAAIAFHCAIVIFMMLDCPSAKLFEQRNYITRLTLYIADYCMERFLFKFSQENNRNILKESNLAKANINFTSNDVLEWKRRHEAGEGWGTIAKVYGTTKDVVRGRVNRVA